MDTGANARCGRGWIRRFSALALASFLIGCVADPNLQHPEANAAAQPQPATATEKPTPKPIESATDIAVAPPAQLIGMSRTDIIRHLGQPAFQRRDQAALLLRYREGSCILDLFLYPRDKSGPGKAVDYIEARATDGRRIKTRPCIDAVRKAKAAG